MVAVIGTAIVQTLYTDGSDPIGQQIRINGLSFTVIGVLSSKSGGAGNQDKVVIAPITTVQSRLGGADARTSTGEYRVSNITVETTSASLNAQVQADITALLSDRHQIQYVGEEDFRIFSQGAIVDILNSILGLLTLFLGMIAGISLLVGGIGVMNIMLVTVT